MTINMTTAAGFVPSTEDDEVTYLGGQFSANIDAGIDLDPDQAFGQIIGIFAKEYQQATELLATCFNMVNPNAAEGVLLANVSALTGTIPQVATYGVVYCTLVLAPGTTVSAGSLVSVAGQPTNTWSLETALTYAGDGTHNWTSPAVAFLSTQTGVVGAPAATVTQIGSPVVGWLSVTNPNAAIPGQAADTDTSLRLRRNVELSAQGGSNIDAVRAAVVEAVSPYFSGYGAATNSCWVTENATSEPDINGVPPNAIHVVYWDGNPTPGGNTPLAAIAQAIWSEKGSGIATFGALSAVVTDSLGGTHTIYFDIGISVPIYINLVTTPTTLTSAQSAAIKSAVTAYTVSAWAFGVNVLAIPMVASALVPGNGVTDIPSWALGTTNPPSSEANILILPNQIPVLALVTVNGS